MFSALLNLSGAERAALVVVILAALAVTEVAACLAD